MLRGGWRAAAVVLAVLLIAGTARAQSNCTSTGFEINGDTAQMAGMRLTILAGTSCAMTLTGSTRTAARIDVSPQHGRVEVVAQGLVFHADAGYAGIDAFRVSWFIPGMTNRVGVDAAVTIVAPRAAPRDDAMAPARGNARPAPAGGPDKLGLYGALVYSRTSRTFGIAINRRTRDDAIREAQRQCGRDDCRVVSPMRSDECLAFAVGDAGTYYIRRRGGDPSQDVLRICRERGYGNCEVVTARCM